MEDSQKFELEFEAENESLSPGVVNAEKESNTSLNIIDPLPLLHESTEPQPMKRNTRYNLRQSLAWDSAFFSSSGVLDPEELSSMITGDKAQKNVLNGIEEDISGLTESISTLQSDNLTLESLEDDLFLNIRASIQRSSKTASPVTNSSTKIAAAEVDSGATCKTMKKGELASQRKNLKLAPKKSNDLPIVRLPKCMGKQTNSKRGSGKEDSVGSGRAKSERGTSKLVSRKLTQPPKIPIDNGARQALPRPTASSKSSSLGSSTTSRVHFTRSSTSSGSSVKSSPMTAKRNPANNNSNVRKTPLRSIPKTPSRVTSKNKLPSSTLSNKISPSVSPASSISEWSSVSSYSVVNSSAILDASSSATMDYDINVSNPENHFTDENIGERINHGLTLPGKFSTGTTLQSRMKPSGLRKPSPKIGFFDGAKSQSGFSTVLPKSGPAVCCSPTRSSNTKLKSSKVPTSGIVIASAKIKPNSPNSSSPKSFHEKSHALENDWCALPDVNSSLCMTLELQGEARDENCLQKAGKVQVEDIVEHVVNIGKVSIIDEKLGELDNKQDLNMHKNMGTQHSKSATVEQGNASYEYILANQNHIQNISFPICEANEKENALVEVQRDGLKGPVDTNLNFAVTVSETSPYRAPLALKNFPSNHECTKISKDSAACFTENTTCVLPCLEQKENN